MILSLKDIEDDFKMFQHNNAFEIEYDFGNNFKFPRKFINPITRESIYKK